MSREPYIFDIQPGDAYDTDEDHRNMVRVRFGYAGLQSEPIEADFVSVKEAIKLIGQLASAVTVIENRK